MIILFMNVMLKRKVRKVGSSIVITLPSHLTEAYNIKCGDYLEIIPYKDDLILKKEKREIKN